MRPRIFLIDEVSPHVITSAPVPEGVGSGVVARGGTGLTDKADKRKVLVIDDELGPRESMRFLLTPEYDVICADSVDGGLDVLRQAPVGLVISDVRMPGTNGLDGLRLLREVDPGVPVILFSGYEVTEMRARAVQAGANAFIPKPFDNREMRATVARYVRQV
jgi:DNA-binding NtrC family response regulator